MRKVSFVLADRCYKTHWPILPTILFIHVLNDIGIPDWGWAIFTVVTIIYWAAIALIRNEEVEVDPFNESAKTKAVVDIESLLQQVVKQKFNEDENKN